MQRLRWALGPAPARLLCPLQAPPLHSRRAAHPLTLCSPAGRATAAPLHPPPQASGLKLQASGRRGGSRCSRKKPLRTQSQTRGGGPHLPTGTSAPRPCPHTPHPKAGPWGRQVGWPQVTGRGRSRAPGPWGQVCQRVPVTCPVMCAEPGDSSEHLGEAITDPGSWEETEAHRPPVSGRSSGPWQGRQVQRPGQVPRPPAPSAPSPPGSWSVFLPTNPPSCADEQTQVSCDQR